MFREILSGILKATFARRGDRDVAQQIYGAVVAQSRQPAFYLRYGIEDTVTGRFDILCLHVFLLSNRLAGEGDPAARALGQEVFDRFTDDVDRALREIGIGDVSVPKRKKRLIRGFYGQVDDFAAPLDAGDATGLAAKADARFFGSAGDARADLLAHYMLKARDRLKAMPLAEIAAARIEWPDPEEIP